MAHVRNSGFWGGRRQALVCLCLMTASILHGQERPPQLAATDPNRPSTPLTQEQGEDILNELRLIRQALQDAQRATHVALPSTPAAASEGTLHLSESAGWFSVGSVTAPVVLVEFTDLQCPFCKQFNKDTLPEIRRTYIDTGKVRFVSRDYPLAGHPDALNAARAVRCAGAQTRYWEMRELLMEGDANLSVGSLEQDAKTLVLDVPRFRECMKDHALVTAINDDITAGEAIGIAGTPAFIVGRSHDNAIEGVRIDGAQPFSQFASAIDATLAKKENGALSGSK